MGESKENPELAEVQAILLKVQQLSQSSAAQPSAGKAQAASRVPSNMLVFDRKHNALQKVEQVESSKRTAVYLGIAAAVIIFAAGIIAAQIMGTPGYLTVGGNAGNEAGLLTEVHRLLGQGDVARAQTSLLRAEPEKRAGVAFALAQTYDPNYLRSLPNANIAADPSEAARWYKKWYELAVQSGLKMDAGQLQRIVNSMQKR
jgi:hypothetical protein